MSEARDLLLSLADKSPAAREAAVLEARDLWVEWPLCDVRILSPGHELVLRVTSDVFALGTSDDPIRVPLSGPGCQAVADALGMSLITSAISDSIWRCADVRLTPLPWGPPYDASMQSVDRVLVHNERIESQRNGRRGLVAGHKKDVVLTNRLLQQPKQVAIYGWIKGDGNAIQPLSLVHESTYMDYSHGLRLCATTASLDGAAVPLADVFASPSLAPLVSREGVLKVTRYPGT